MTQPEALRLADLLEQIDGQYWQVQDSAAAELRRLYDLADKYKWQVIDTCARAEKAETQRDALLEALKEAVDICGWPSPEFFYKALAAIAKCEENT